MWERGSVAWRTLAFAVATLVGGCSRSGLGLGLTVDVGNGSAGAGGDSTFHDRFVDATAPADAGAGNAPGAGGTGGGDAGAPVDAGADATPPEPPPDIVFSRSVSGTTSLYEMHLADFSVRKVDPSPASLPVLQEPLAYSPDGRKLLVVEVRNESTVIFVAHPCRDASCAGQVVPYAEVLRGPPKTALRNPLFAKDSGGLVFEFGGAEYYESLGGVAAQAAMKLSDTKFDNVHFVQGGVLAEEGAAPYVEFIEVGGTAPVHHTLTGSGGVVLNWVQSVSPDGAHWVAAGTSNSFFDASEVSEGLYEGHALPGASSVVAGDRFVATLSATGVSVELWGGTQAIGVPNSSGDQLYGCGNRAVLVGTAVQTVSLDAPSDSPLPALSLGGAPSATPFFTADCAKAVFSTQARTSLVDLRDGAAIDGDTLKYSELNRHGTLMMGGNQGIQTATRVDTLSSAAPLSYAPRTTLGGGPLFSNEGLFYLAAAPLLDTMDPGIFRVDFSDPSQVAVEALTGPKTGVSSMTLSPDDVHLAYGNILPDVPVDPASVSVGVYEMDLATKKTTLIAPATRETAGGATRWQVIPGRRKLLVLGTYGGDVRESLYGADLDAQSFVSEMPATSARLFVDTDFTDDAVLSSDGKAVWYRGVGDAPSRFAQPLRFAETESLAPAVVLAFDPKGMAYATDQTDETLGFPVSVGPVYAPYAGNVFSGGADTHSVDYFDVTSGQGRVLAQSNGATDSVYATAVGQQTGRIVLWRSSPTSESISYVEAGSLDTERVVFSDDGNNLNGARISPDERWVEYTVWGSDRSKTDLRFFDFQSRTGRTFTDDQIGSTHVDFVSFDPDSAHALVQTYENKEFNLDLLGSTAPILVIPNFRYGPQLSADHRWGAWTTASGTAVGRLDGSLKSTLVTTLTNPSLVLSPSGRYIVVLDASGVWQLLRTDALDAAPVVLADATQATMAFDPTEQYVIGNSYGPDAPSPMAIWKLTDPGTPHYLLESGEIGTYQWLPAPPLASSQ